MILINWLISRSRWLQGLSLENPLNPLTQPPMERDMENHSEIVSASMSNIEGVPVEEEVVESLPPIFLP